MKKHRKLITISLVTLSSMLSVGTATASFLPGGMGEEWQQWTREHLNPLSQIQEQIAKGESLLNTIMKGGLGGAWDEILAKTGTQTPDPYQVRTADQSMTGGVLETNPIVQKRDSANLYDQELTRAMAAPVLGETGRKWLESEIKRTSDVVENNQQGLQVTQKLAQDAQSLTATQDVVKNNTKAIASLAGLITNQSRLTADNQTALLKIQQLQGISAQLAANTSEGIDEANRRERVARQIELSSATRTDLYIPGLYNTNSPSPRK
jgi:hypothetical protein